MLDTVIRAFTRGILDPDAWQEALRGLVSADRSLVGVYTMGEEPRRAKAEYIRKLLWCHLTGWNVLAVIKDPYIVPESLESDKPS